MKTDLNGFYIQISFLPSSGSFEDDDLEEEITLKIMCAIIFEESTNFVDRPFTEEKLIDILNAALRAKAREDYCFMCRKGIRHSYCPTADLSLTEGNIDDTIDLPEMEDIDRISDSSSDSANKSFVDINVNTSADDDRNRVSRLDSGISIDTSISSCDTPNVMLDTPSPCCSHHSSSVSLGHLPTCSSSQSSSSDPDHIFLSPAALGSPLALSTPQRPMKVQPDHNLPQSLALGCKRKLDLEDESEASTSDVSPDVNDQNKAAKPHPSGLLDVVTIKTNCPECGCQFQVTRNTSETDKISSPAPKPVVGNFDSGVADDDSDLESDLESGLGDDFDDTASVHSNCTLHSHKSDIPVYVLSPKKSDNSHQESTDDSQEAEHKAAVSDFIFNSSGVTATYSCVRRRKRGSDGGSIRDLLDWFRNYSKKISGKPDVHLLTAKMSAGKKLLPFGVKGLMFLYPHPSPYTCPLFCG